MATDLSKNNFQTKLVNITNDYRVNVLNTGNKSVVRFPHPEVICRLPFKRNPLHDKHQEHIIELANWLYQYGGLASTKWSRVASGSEYASFFWPFCTDMERYETGFVLMLNVFIHDDGTECNHGDSKEHLDKCSKVWADFHLAMDRLIAKGKDHYIPMTYWDPSVMSMHALHEKICHEFNDVQTRRFVYYWKYYIQGCVEEIEFIRENRPFKSVEEYLTLRIKSIGTQFVMQLVEYTDHIYITDDEYNDPDMLDWIRLGATSTIFQNDVWSFEAEYVEMNGNLSAMFNIVAVIVLLDKCSVGDAMARAMDMHVKGEVEMFARKEKIISKPNCRDELKTFIEKAGYVVSGNNECSKILDRYHDLQ